jgi:energy-coupling factor transporter ATP-binding protein EcfA2
MTLVFAPATKSASKARIALCGPSGSGKTYTALSLAARLAERIEGNIAVIDTERGSASKYVGTNGWQFDTVTPDKFSPVSLTELLGVASGAGYAVTIVDSWSHYWSGTDGMQEQADRRAKGGNSFSGWKEIKPDERRMIDAMVSYPGHLIVTMRSKTQYVIEQIERNGRTTNVPKKIGLKPDQREGIEYEFDLVGDLDLDNVLTVSKSRIPILSRAIIEQPGPDFADSIADWLEEGTQSTGVDEYRTRALASGLSTKELVALHAEVKKSGLLGAPVLDDRQKPTSLGDLIVMRGHAARDREQNVATSNGVPKKGTAATSSGAKDPRETKMAHLFVILKNGEITSDEQRHQISSRVLQRKITTWKDLTLEDATVLVETLEPLAKQGPLAEVFPDLATSDAS